MPIAPQTSARRKINTNGGKGASFYQEVTKEEEEEEAAAAAAAAAENEEKDKAGGVEVGGHFEKGASPDDDDDSLSEDDDDDDDEGEQHSFSYGLPIFIAILVLSGASINLFIQIPMALKPGLGQNFSIFSILWISSNQLFFLR